MNRGQVPVRIWPFHLFGVPSITIRLGKILFRHPWFFAILAIGMGFGQSAWAAESPVTSATLERVGFEGRFKVGQWTPLTVRVETERACRLELDVETADPEGNRAVWTDQFDLPSAGTHRLTMLFQPGRLETALKPSLTVKPMMGDEQWTVPVVAGEDPAAQLVQRALPHSVLMVGTLGDPGGLNEESRSPGETDEEETSESRIPIRVAALKDASELIVASAAGQEAAYINAAGLEALDTLVISGQYAMDARQAEALKTWVTLGGHLILSVGRDWESYQQSPLARWLSAEVAEAEQPFRLTGTTTFKRLDALESFAGKNAASISIDLQNPVVGVKIEPGKNAEAMLSVLSGPLIVRSPYGFGTVTLLGLSLSEEPVKSWPSLPRAMRKLLWDAKQPTRSQSKSANNRLAYSGISEFATQMHTALQTFRPVHRLSTWAIIGLMAIYLLVIGPLDYFLVNRLLKRPRLTWLTFPAWVAIAAVIGVSLSRSHNGDKLLTSQLNILDYDAATETTRSRSWASLYSPETRRYQVTLEPEGTFQSFSTATSGAPQARMSFFGIPETVFGGMYREGGQSLSPPIYRFAPQAQRIENLPISIWGAKSIEAEWCGQGRVWVEGKLTSPRPGQLRGTIRHHFPVPITDWFLAYDTRVFLPRPNLDTGEADPLPPEIEWPRNDEKWQRIKQREISGYLTRAVAKQFQRTGENSGDANAIRSEQQTYDPLAENNADPLGDIVRTLTFHRQVGGKQYTGLDNYALREMDLSGRLGLKRAILYGRLDLSTTSLQIPDHEPANSQTATFIRIVLPVEENHVEAPPLKLKKDD